MVQKRQVSAEEYNVSSKHLKLENSCHLVPSLEFPLNDVALNRRNSGIPEARSLKEIPENTPEFQSDKNPQKPTLIQPEYTYSCLIQYPPLKEIPIGPDHQANIPESSNSCNTRNYESKFIGSCIISMPELNQNICKDDQVGKGRSDCCCQDSGSLRCVRQHIPESRERLRREFGQDRFSALGFDSMGDIVACKWTVEDEQLFHKIVYSNPVSLGKDFWEKLAETFPSRTKQEIVSYYFNVFVLQRRAEQNRFDPMNADSDDDEWQENDPCEDEDDLCHDEIEKYGFSIKDSIFDYKDYLFQENSCTSSEFQESQTTDVNVDFIFDQSDSKDWGDVGYFSFPRKKNDFLSTGSMIEEVFGVESWNFKVTDNDKGSN